MSIRQEKMHKYLGWEKRHCAGVQKLRQVLGSGKKVRTRGPEKRKEWG